MTKGLAVGFSKAEKLVIKAPNIWEASFELGLAFKEENRLSLEKIRRGMDENKRREVVEKSKRSWEDLRTWASKRTFVVGGINRLARYLESMEGYCKGSGLSVAEGAWLQMEISGGCQSLLIQELASGRIEVIHTEEDLVPENKNGYQYPYKWVEMNLPDRKISFFGYPGLCGWGSTCGVNETTKMIQVVDDLLIRPEYLIGSIWANAVAFVIMDIGDTDLIKQLVDNLGKEKEVKFMGGYAIQLAQAGKNPSISSIEFGHDLLKITDPIKVGGRLIKAQVNCPLDDEIQEYGLAAYPKKGRQWTEHEAELYIEMTNRRARLEEAGRTIGDLGGNPEENIRMGLELLADPRGDIGRDLNKETGEYKYYSSGLPSNVTVAHFVGIIDGDEIQYYVGKLTPRPIRGWEYEIEVNEDYKYGLKRIWEEAERVRKDMVKLVNES